MKITLTPYGVTLRREPGDKALSHESTVTHHIRRLLRVQTGANYVRFYPCKEGLTSCREGVIDRKSGVCYWHGNYAIEAAHKAFNAGEVTFNREELNK